MLIRRSLPGTGGDMEPPASEPPHQAKADVKADEAAHVNFKPRASCSDRSSIRSEQMASLKFGQRPRGVVANVGQ